MNRSARLGEVAWAFEYNDRMGRFNCFYYGATEGVESGLSPSYGKCLTLPELTKAMSREGSTRAGFDEVKVLEVEEADPEGALQFLFQRSVAPGEGTSVEEAREVLVRYGVHGLAASRGFSAPFLWYNTLPGRSVPLRKLPIHLFELRISSSGEESSAGMETRIRKLVQSEADSIELKDCFVSRAAASFLVGLQIAVDGGLTVRESRLIGERIENSIRKAFPKVSRIFTQIEAFVTPESSPKTERVPSSEKRNNQ